MKSNPTNSHPMTDDKTKEDTKALAVTKALPDKTIVAEPKSEGTLNVDATARTIPEKVLQSSVDTIGDVFYIKGIEYRKKKCLSDTSGEAQVFLEESDEQKEYVLKVYYPNFEVNRKLLQTILSFDFEMIVRLYDFGKTYVQGKHRYYE